jgi:hypothetical protein
VDADRSGGPGDLNKVIKTKTEAATTKEVYKPKEFIPGITHFIEGRSNLNEVTPGIEKTLAWRKKTALDTSVRHNDPRLSWRETGASREARRDADVSNAEISSKLASYKAEDEARSKLRTKIDPDRVRVDERKQAARRRMRGRLGTMLSARESLA